MMLTNETVAALVDLIENKLNMMHIGDREDLREMVTLKRALGELHRVHTGEMGSVQSFSEIPRRGRRRKVAALLSQHAAEARETV